MGSTLSNLETKLNEVFVHNAPALPKGGKKMLVAWAPVVSVIVGILSLWSAWNLWHWAHVASSLNTYANAVCNAYSVSGCGGLVTSRYSIWLWLGVAVIAVEGILYLLAYSGLRDHKKVGWNYLFYGALVNVAYAIVSLFTGHNGASNFIGALIGSAIGFYLLFQIRESYLGKKPVSPGNPPKSSDS